MDRIESSNFFKTNKFGLLHHIQLVHLLSLPAMSANLHLFFPMHVSRQKVGFGGGASIYIYISVGFVLFLGVANFK